MDMNYKRRAYKEIQQPRNIECDTAKVIGYKWNLKMIMLRELCLANAKETDVLFY